MSSSYPTGVEGPRASLEHFTCNFCGEGFEVKMVHELGASATPTGDSIECPVCRADPQYEPGQCKWCGAPLDEWKVDLDLCRGCLA